MNKRIIVVFGATGAQGRGVVDQLAKEGMFHVRAVSRSPEKYAGNAHEVVKADLNELDTLKSAFKNAYGVFLVTNFWEGADELSQGKTAVTAAREAGIEHFVWSTLPDVESISKGEFHVPHFTFKARVDEIVRQAGFRYHTFVQPPFYYQNLSGMLSPQPKQDGTTGWTLPIDPAKKVIHMSDINDLGKVVSGAFMHPDTVGNGACLSLATEMSSFDDIISAFKANGKDYSFTQVPGEMFSNFFEGAKELAEMFGYFEKYTYMGPDSKPRIDLAKQIAGGELLSFKDWIKRSL